MPNLIIRKMFLNTLGVSYLDEGPKEAPILLFIHGFPLNKAMWSGQMEELTEDFRVIAYDVRGHGDSHLGTEDFSIELFVKDLIDLMDVLNIEKVILCGLSMGGYIALNASLNYPSRFEGLVLCDTNCIADSPETVKKRMKGIDNIKKNGVAHYADESIKNLFAERSFRNNNGAIDRVREMIVNTSEESLYLTLQALAKRQETCSRLPELKIPTLILVGKEDKITPPSAAEVLHKGITNSSLTILENAAHLSNMENPKQFNKEITAFVTKVQHALQPEKG